MTNCAQGLRKKFKGDSMAGQKKKDPGSVIPPNHRRFRGSRTRRRGDNTTEGGSVHVSTGMMSNPCARLPGRLFREFANPGEKRLVRVWMEQGKAQGPNLAARCASPAYHAAECFGLKKGKRTGQAGRCLRAGAGQPGKSSQHRQG